MNIEYTDAAAEDLKRMPLRHADQITRKIARLSDGLAGDIKALVNATSGYRLRSGVYRILVDCQAVVVRRIKHRRDAYR